MDAVTKAVINQKDFYFYYQDRSQQVEGQIHRVQDRSVLFSKCNQVESMLC